MKTTFIAILVAGVAAAQSTPDAELTAAIAQIKAIDNHAHPLRYVAAGGKADDEYDALPCDTIEAAGLTPVRLRPDNPEFLAAWRGFFGISQGSQAGEARKQKIAQLGAAYPAWVLDQIGTETMLANRVGMGAGMTGPRFRWVTYVDALMFPVHSAAEGTNADYKFFYAAEYKVRKKYYDEAGLKSAPATLGEYLTRVVTATLEHQKQNGAVGVKFEAAYLRSLDFPDVPRAEAGRIYARYLKAPEAPADEAAKLQSFLFRYIARECGRLGLPVQIHSSLGCGDYFQIHNANPLLLESVINDPALRKTNFVLIHGGWPATPQIAALLSKPNVWTDLSFMALMLYPRGLADVTRGWLEMFPERVLFGTDAFSASAEIGWEETAWIGSQTARQALVMALQGMIQDGEITRERAVVLARMVLRENAQKLYGLH